MSALTATQAHARPVEAVLVHGAGGGAWEWLQWEEALEARGIASRPIELEPCAQGYEVCESLQACAMTGMHLL
jgi:hypothetical protein